MFKKTPPLATTKPKAKAKAKDENKASATTWSCAKCNATNRLGRDACDKCKAPKVAPVSSLSSVLSSDAPKTASAAKKKEPETIEDTRAPKSAPLKGSNASPSSKADEKKVERAVLTPAQI